MLSFEEARRLILSSVAALRIERVSLLEAIGRVLAEEVFAPFDLPACDNSAMDGYAVRSADCASPARLKVTGYIPAGCLPAQSLLPGCAIRIMTGAPIPPGCDAVVPVEQTEAEPADAAQPGGIGGHVQIKAAVRPRQQIRFTGEDVARGESVLSPGTLLHAPAISLLASFGKAWVAVYARVSVAILSTGDELVELGEPLTEGRIVNSNTHSLAASLREIGAIPVILGIARDDPSEMRAKLLEGFKSDAMITSAGVSAGDRDFVRDVLDELQLRQLFRQVEIRPGGPTAFGLRDGKPVFSLPGNPVATMIIFETLVRPALLKMMGHRRVLRAPFTAILQHELRKKEGKVQCVRVRLQWSEGRLLASSAGDQNTGILKTMLLADGLAILPAESTFFAPGDAVSVQLLSGDALMREES